MCTEIDRRLQWATDMVAALRRYCTLRQPDSKPREKHEVYRIMDVWNAGPTYTQDRIALLGALGVRVSNDLSPCTRVHVFHGGNQSFWIDEHP